MLSSLAQRVLQDIRKRELMRAGERVAIAVSGGADSVALLRLMAELKGELGVVLSVAHFNHRIRGEASDQDEAFVRELASSHDLQFWFAAADVPAYARDFSFSLEAAARLKRYEFFENIIAGGGVGRLATAHTLDDQAETVLMRAIRGTGISGLGAIYPRVNVRDEHSLEVGEIVRPLLNVRRPELEAYLRSLQQAWHDDASNGDLHHTRNRIRQRVVPLLEREFNPAVSERLTELAEIARAEEEFWIAHLEKALVGVLRHEVTATGTVTARLHSRALLQHPLAIQRRLVRRAADPLGISLPFSKVEEVLALARGVVAGKIDLGQGFDACRVREDVVIAPAAEAEQAVAACYEYRMNAHDRCVVELRELGTTLIVSSGSLTSGPGALSPAKLTTSELVLRPWRPGDRFWPQHSSGQKKVKKLLTDKHIIGLERQLWPVIACGDDIVWLRGYGVSHPYAVDENAANAIVITEHPLGSQN